MIIYRRDASSWGCRVEELDLLPDLAGETTRTSQFPPEEESDHRVITVIITTRLYPSGHHHDRYSVMIIIVNHQPNLPTPTTITTITTDVTINCNLRTAHMHIVSSVTRGTTSWSVEMAWIEIYVRTRGFWWWYVWRIFYTTDTTVDRLLLMMMI